MLMIASCYSDGKLMEHVEELAREAKWSNVEMMAAFMRKDVEACVKLLIREKRYPEVGSIVLCNVGCILCKYVCSGNAKRGK